MAIASISLLISLNDLEAFEIVRLAEERGNVDPRYLGLRWGDAPDAALLAIPIAELKPVVILVECPSPAYEAAVRASGRIVHVVDHHLRCGADGRLVDRRSSRSSLEQVAHLLGVAALTPDQRKIAANDSGFWPGLFQELTACEPVSGPEFVAAARDIREQDIGASIASRNGSRDIAVAEARAALAAAKDWLNEALTSGEAVVIRPQAHKSGLSNPVFYLIRTPRSEHRNYLSDAAYLHRLSSVCGNIQPEHLAIEICILGMGDGDHCDQPTELFLSGSGQLGDAIPQLIERVRDHPDGTGTTVYGGAGARAAFLGISAERAIGSIVDVILGELLQGSRPLERYCTQFVQALRVKDTWAAPKEIGSLRPVTPVAQTLAYFTPSIRNRIADPAATDNDHNLRTFELPWGEAEFVVHWGAAAEDRPVTRVKVNRIRLHLAPERIVFVEWVIGGSTTKPEIGAFWAQLFEVHRERNPEAITTLADLLDVNEAVRFVAPAFINDSKQRAVSLTIDGKPEPPVSLEFGKGVAADMAAPTGWFAFLLKHALGPLGLKPDDVDIRFDARARSVHAAVLAGPRPQTVAGIAHEDTMLARLAGVDEYGPTPFYDRAFNDAELESWRYRRFADQGTHFAASGYSFAMLGYGSFPAEYSTEKRWFSAPSAALAPTGHVQSLYFPMFLLTQLHLVVFDALAQEHGDAIRDRREAGNDAAMAQSIKRIRALRGRLTDYLASLWFDDVSPELQGQDLYGRMLDRSGAGLSVERLRSAIADADAVEADREEEQRADEADRAQRQRDSLALLGTAIATPLLLMSLGAPLLTLWAETGAAGRIVAQGDAASVALDSTTRFMVGSTSVSPGWIYAIAGALLVLVTLWVTVRREQVTLARDGETGFWPALKSVFGHASRFFTGRQDPRDQTPP